MDPGFQFLQPVEPPQGLYRVIHTRIAALERRAARVRLIAFGAVALTCALVLVPVMQYTLQQFAASGFDEYLSLLFADNGVALSYWREFGLSLVESLPSLALLLLLPLCAALWWSLKRAWRGAHGAFSF